LETCSLQNYLDENLNIKNFLDFENKEMISLIKTCINYIEEDNENKEEIYYDSFDWRANKQVYGKNHLDGKYYFPKIDTRKEVVTWLLNLLLNTDKNNENYFEVICKIVDIAAKRFLECVRILPNNIERCIYLRIIILTKNEKNKKININDVINFNKDRDVNYCCFEFNCNDKNQEDNKICGYKCSIEKIMKNLYKKDIINYYSDGFYTK